jgi:hypothetical protein
MIGTRLLHVPFDHDTSNHHTLALFTGVTPRRFLQHDATHVCEEGIDVIVPFPVEIPFTLLFPLRGELGVTHTRQISKHVDLKSVTPVRAGVT